MRRFFELRQLRSFTLPGLFRYIMLRSRGKALFVRGHCNVCGACCRSVCLEDEKGWLRSEKRFLKIIDLYPEYGRFVVSGKDRDGNLLFTCTWLTAEGFCRDHEHRLPLCRRYPEKSLAFSGGVLPTSCGYSFQEVTPFKKYLQQAIDKKSSE